ncbi:MAG: hypothetical protein IT426_02140 [Pirellulales bacterium]|nr:hypothetical protein [Pirellulales bacterium]
MSFFRNLFGKKEPQLATTPKPLMVNILWCFSGSPFNDRVSFDEAVRKFQIKIRKGEDEWQPEQIVLRYPRIRIQYMCWQGDDQIEPILELVSDNGEYFTAGELLFKIHNAVVDQLSQIDHKFFEGLSLDERGSVQVPLYQLGQGS